MEEESNDSDDDVDDGKNVDEVEETHTDVVPELLECRTAFVVLRWHRREHAN